eukprot:SAG22_NODE_2786_length_2211_cov_1.304451_1_plen_255_part_10
MSTTPIAEMDSEPYYEGSCYVACPPHSTGTSVADGCTCESGYTETSPGITASDHAPFYTGGCFMLCPEHSTGVSVEDGCTCDSGYALTNGINISITTTPSGPEYVGGCARHIPCTNVSNSIGVSVGDANFPCSCVGGFEAFSEATGVMQRASSIVPSDTSPYYEGVCCQSGSFCCPEGSHSSGAGCACDAGYAGEVARLSGGPPFYFETCEQIACPALSASTGAGLGDGCQCEFGTSGTITATTTPPHYYTGTCS